jgi:hypothetical protein
MMTTHSRRVYGSSIIQDRSPAAARTARRKGAESSRPGERALRTSGPRRAGSEDTSTASYRRIEARGRTSRKRAEAIAQILDVTLAELEGIVPPDTGIYEKRILDLLAEQLRQENVVLKSALDEACSDGSDSEDGLASMARNVARRIEAAQLARNPGELAELSQLTGLSEGEILEPAHVDGHWLVVASGPIYTRTELVLGTAGVMTLIPEIVGMLLEDFGSDGRIRMHRAPPWYRLEIDPLCGRFTTWIDFVRCLPDARGVRWLKPGWRDVFLLEEPLLTWARSAANFVTGFDGSPTPGDVRRLRLQVTEYNGESGERISEQIVSGALEEVPDERLAAEREVGKVTLSQRGRLEPPSRRSSSRTFRPTRASAGKSP